MFFVILNKTLIRHMTYNLRGNAIALSDTHDLFSTFNFFAQSILAPVRQNERHDEGDRHLRRQSECTIEYILLTLLGVGILFSVHFSFTLELWISIANKLTFHTLNKRRASIKNDMKVGDLNVHSCAINCKDYSVSVQIKIYNPSLYLSKYQPLHIQT